MKMSFARGSACLLSLVTLIAVTGCAQRRAAQQMQDLNQAALADLRKGKASDAKKELLEAVRVGKDAGLDSDPVMAQTHLALGAIYAVSPKEADRAAAHFGEALAITPDAKLPKVLSTAASRKALAKAKAAARADKDKEKAEAKSETKAEAKSETKAEAEKPAKKAEPLPPPPAPEVAVAEPAPPPKRKKASEPDLPAEIREPLQCVSPDQTPPNHEVTLRCVPRGRVGKVALFYRSAGSETFTEVPMPRTPKGWYVAVVPASAVTGKSLQYYMESSGGAQVHNGSSDSPNLLLVRADAPAGDEENKDGDQPPPGGHEDENPLASIEHEQEVAQLDLHRRTPGSVFVGFGLGTGYGYTIGHALEFRTDQEVGAGPLSGGLLHLLPELGYQWDDHLAFSVQVRLQYIPTEGSGDATPGAPATKALAVLLRGVYAVGEGNWRGFLSGVAGGGDGFRLKVPPQPAANLPRSDTVRGGPVVVGAGAGFAYHFNRHVAWPTEARLLLGVPSIAAVVEISTGVELGF